MLAGLLLVIAVSCGGGATSTAAPQPESVAPAAEPAAEPEAVEETKDTGEAEVQVSPTATPVPVPEAEVAAEPEVVTTGAEPYGGFTLALHNLGRFSGHVRYAVSGEQFALAGVTTHEGLLTVDGDSRYHPLLAESWSVASDDRTWTFKLRKGIEFHKGWGEVTPEDIINTIRELGADDAAACGCAQTQAIFNNPDGYFIGLDNYTLELDTVLPAWDVLTWIHTPGYTRIFSKKQFDTLLESGLDEFEAGSQLVGTGPFELTEDMSTEEWNFTAVRDHWRKTPEFAELKFVAIPEESTRIANFLTGKIDVWQAAEDSIPIVAEDPGTKFMSQEGVSEFYMIIWQNGYTYYGTDEQRAGYNPDLAWVSSNPDVDSPEWERARKVREAMGLAVDRQKIVDTLLGGEGLANSVYGWGTHRSRTPASWDWQYDPDRARELLKEAGYEDGFDIDISPSFTSAPASVVSACAAVGDMLGDVGINATSKVIPAAILYPQFKDRTQQGITCQYQAAYPQEPLWLHVYSYAPEGIWGLGWDHPWYTEIMGRANKTFDADERWELQLEMGQWMRDNALGISVYASNQIYPLGPKLDSWEEHLSMGSASRISGLEYAIHRR